MMGIKRILSIIMICMFASTVAISADTTVDTWKKKLEETNKQLKETKNAINQAQSQKKTVSKQVAELDNKLHQAEQELGTVEGQLSNLESQIVVTKRDLERASQAAAGQKEESELCMKQAL